jgi:hypothetical protein
VWEIKLKVSVILMEGVGLCQVVIAVNDDCMNGTDFACAIWSAKRADIMNHCFFIADCSSGNKFSCVKVVQVWSVELHNLHFTMPV